MTPVSQTERISSHYISGRLSTPPLGYQPTASPPPFNKQPRSQLPSRHPKRVLPTSIPDPILFFRHRIGIGIGVGVKRKLKEDEGAGGSGDGVHRAGGDQQFVLESADCGDDDGVGAFDGAGRVGCCCDGEEY